MSDPFGSLPQVDERYRLLLDQSERMLDVQLGNLSEEMRRSQTLIQVGMATVGGTIAVATLLLNAGIPLDGALVSTFGVAVLLAWDWCNC